MIFTLLNLGGLIINLEEEYEIIRKMNYKQLVIYLKNKYGEIKYPYFCNQNCKSKQSKNSKTNEGLFIHHIREDTCIDLSNKDFAKKYPWEYQLPENLVYANLIEHSMLHCLIFEEYGLSKFPMILGIGYFDLTMQFVEDIRDNYPFKQNYRKIVAEQVRPYFYILEDIFKRVGVPILTQDEKEKIRIDEEKEDNQKMFPKDDLSELKDCAKEYLAIENKDSKKLPRYKIINYFDYFYDSADSKEKYIEYNRDQLICILDSLCNKILKTKNQEDYDNLIRNS